MTKIKLCGLRRPCEIAWVNRCKPDYIGFVFAEQSKRFVDPTCAAQLKRLLDPSIRAVGVFVDAPPEQVAALLGAGIIDLAQLHGAEDAHYIRRLRTLTDKPLIQAFCMDSPQTAAAVNASEADWVLLDAGSGGTGRALDWHTLGAIHRPYFLAGGLHPDNVAQAIAICAPYAVDVSSGIERDGCKAQDKMAAFITAVRKGEVR